jgi:hypothetical protein
MSLTLKINHDYRINKNYPYAITKIGSNRPVKESVSKSNGYVNLYLNREKYLKHRIVALQFLSNPHGYKEVDHKNRNITDFHVRNLRWVNRVQNMNNTSRSIHA